MAHIIRSNNCVTAWRDACVHMLEHGDGFNLLVQIDNPLDFTEAQILDICNSGVISSTTINDIVNTIFPAKFHARNVALTNHEFYDRHEQIYIRGKRIRQKNRSRWGTYFLRFTKFGSNRKNQLQPIIDGIRNRANHQKACYTMHVSSIDVDNNTRVIGNPCLQYVQFGFYDDALHLTAVYRNHDFLNKALGNYIGLSKLLEFVCVETNTVMGSVTVQSVHYELKSRRTIKNCVDNLHW